MTELAKESADNVKYPFESLGKKEASDHILLDHGNYKGNLHYVAEFVPALALRGVEFKSEPNALQLADTGSDAETVETASLFSLEDAKIPQGITTRRPLGDDEDAEETSSGHVKDARSADTTATVGATNGAQDVVANMEKEETGVKMTKEELLAQRMDCLIPSPRA